MKNVLGLSQLSFILVFQMLATSFDLNCPSSGQYSWKLKNGGAYNITG
jgi:hypothetical protein